MSLGALSMAYIEKCTESCQATAEKIKEYNSNLTMVQWILVILNIVSFLFIIGKMIGKNKDKIGKYADTFRSYVGMRIGGKDDTSDEKGFEMTSKASSSSGGSYPFESTTNKVVNPMHRHPSTKTSSSHAVNPMHALKKGKKTKEASSKKTSTSSLTLSKKPSNTELGFKF